jgi:hypothetical protein
VFSLEINKSLEEVEIEDCELEPLYLSKDCENVINILYYENHYMFITRGPRAWRSANREMLVGVT